MIIPSVRAAVVLGLSLAATGSGLAEAPSLRLAPYVVPLGCEISGTPAEFPDDLVFRNRSTITLQPGQRIAWRTFGPVYQDTFTLTSALGPGASVRAAGVLPAGIQAGRPCQARAL